MAATLKEQFQAPEKRATVLDDAVKIIQREVDSKSGISGMAIKGAFKIVQGARPGFIRHVLDRLFDDFLTAIQPFYAKALAEGLPPGGRMVDDAPEVANALLAITDARAARANNETIKKAYQKLRPTAEKHVATATPQLSELLNRHAESA